ncbi:hypothetical protein BGZ98_004405, partial [Dissophora globulifera]
RAQVALTVAVTAVFSVTLVAIDTEDVVLPPAPVDEVNITTVHSPLLSGIEVAAAALIEAAVAMVIKPTAPSGAEKGATSISFGMLLPGLLLHLFYDARQSDNGRLCD